MAEAPTRSTDGIDAGQLLGYFEERRDEMVELIVKLASIESPSRVADAQEPMRSALTAEYEALGLEVRRLEGEDGCDHLMARPTDRDPSRPTQLLLGHLDTVWPVGTLETMPIEIVDGRLHGPGIFDMKAGLVQTIFALRALRELGIETAVDPVVLINADEEIGSPNSRTHTVELAREACRAFVMEPSYGPRGDLKTVRKGIGNFKLTVRGVASHAGLDPDSGVSAILEVSHQVEQLFALNDASRGVTVNVGTIDGGLRPNVIAPEATAMIETRVFTSEDAARVEEAIRGLTPTRDQITLDVEGGFRRPPMEKTPGNRALWAAAQEAASALGFEIGEAQVGGASDGNLTSPLIPTLDGLGAVGDGAHADHEHLIIEKVPQRAALLAMLLASPPTAV